MALTKIWPFAHNVPIVDKAGNPTPYFNTQLQLILEASGILESDILTKADKTITLTAGVGLDGGGDLSANRTFDLNASLNDLNDVDTAGVASGDVLTYDGAQWEPATPAAGGSSFAGADNTLGGASASLFATKGAVVVPFRDIQIAGVWFNIAEVNTGIYRAGIYTLDAGTTITAVLGTTATQTATATATVRRYFPFASPLTLVAGTRYALVHTRTDATTTTSSGLSAGTLDAKGVPIQGTASFLTLASVAPAIGNTFNTGANPFYHGYAYRVL